MSLHDGLETTGSFSMKQHIKTLLAYVLRFWPHFLWASICLALTNFFMVQIPEQIGLAIDGIEKGTSLNAIINIAWMGFVVIIVRSMSRIFFFNPARYVEYEVRKDLFAKLLHLSNTFYGKFNRGDIVSRVSNDIMWVRIMVGFGGLQLVNLFFAFGLTGWKMYSLSSPLFWASLIPISIGFLLVNFVISRLYPMMRKNQEELSQISSHILESFQGVPTIQGFQAAEAFEKKFEEQNEQWFRTGLSLAFWQASFTPLLALSSGGAVCALLYAGGPLIVKGELSVGTMTAFLTLIASLIPHMRSVGWMLSVWHRGIAAMERIFEIMDTPIERPEGANPKPIPELKHAPIRIENLTYAYPESEADPILKNITTTIEPGTMVGIFGRTGAGKTTLLRLLSRTYNPPKDSIFIDDTDICSVDLKEWRSKLAVVPQRAFLFSESIRQNIALEDELSEERLQEAISLSSLRSDLNSFEEGLDTVVGERGIMLSGGQRQRVALARGMFASSSLILLDDVLSAVDHENESKLVHTLYKLSQEGITCFIVSNRVMSSCRVPLSTL